MDSTILKNVLINHDISERDVFSILQDVKKQLFLKELVEKFYSIIQNEIHDIVISTNDLNCVFNWIIEKKEQQDKEMEEDFRSSRTNRIFASVS